MIGLCFLFICLTNLFFNYSVAILIFNKTRNVFVFVRQFRPSVFLSIHQLDDKSKNIADINKQINSKAGYTIELCAGIIDKEGKQ